MDEAVVLLDDRGRKYLVPLSDRMARVPGLGTFNRTKLRGAVGRAVRVGDRSVLVLTPSGRDLRDTMARGPQTLATKDIALVLFEADVRPGGRIVEAGSGSGALTVALARSVGPTGRVVSYDVRDESLRVARQNAERAGIEHRIEFRRADVRAGIAESEVDAVVLDVPDPWAAVPTAWDALRPCGHLATFSPNTEQVKQTGAAIRAKPFVDVRTIELIEREIEVRDVGVRPSSAPLGHTGYLTFARKVLDTF